MKREKLPNKEHKDKNFTELYDFNSLEDIYNYIDRLLSNEDNSLGSALAFNVQLCDENGQIIERFFNIEQQFYKEKDGNAPLEIVELNGQADLIEKFYDFFNEHAVDLADKQNLLLVSRALISVLCERKIECYDEYENFDPVLLAARIGETKCIYEACVKTVL